MSSYSAAFQSRSQSDQGAIGILDAFIDWRVRFWSGVQILGACIRKIGSQSRGQKQAQLRWSLVSEAGADERHLGEKCWKGERQLLSLHLLNKGQDEDEDTRF